MSLPTESEIQQVIDNLNDRYANSDYQISNIFCDIRSNVITIHCMSDKHLGNAYDLVLSLGSEDIMAEMMPDNTGHSKVILEKNEVWLERKKGQ